MITGTHRTARSPRPRLFALAAALLIEACGHSPLEVDGAPSGAFSIAVGQEIEISMGTVGPGSYMSPPTLNGAALSFLGVTSPSVASPGGDEQVFHFKGLATGATIIVFHPTEFGLARPDVSDTVVVR